jgi:hypothetical protein
MGSDEQRLLENELHRIVDDSASRLRQWNDENSNNRWAKIGYEADDMKRRISDALRRHWPGGD